MNENIKKPELSKILDISTKIKDCLEKHYGKKYIQAKKQISEEGTDDSLNSENIFKHFEIIRANPPIYTLINSPSDLSDQINNIKDKFNKLIDEYYTLVEKVLYQLDENTINGLDIIGKLLENRRKKMESSFKKFVPDPSWNTSRIQDEFSHVLVKVLKDILESTSNSISNGFKQNEVYEDIIKILNSFYNHLGVYTKEYKVNEIINDNDDWESINAITSEDNEIKDNSYKDKIKAVDSLAYLFDNKVVILEANVKVWRIS